MITSEYIFNMYLSLRSKVCVYVYVLLSLFSRQVMSDFFATPCMAALQAFPVPHHLPEFAQVHVHEHEHVGDAIQPSHPQDFLNVDRALMYIILTLFLSSCEEF